jgi:Mlc titration factor MtfA (ptsG expression regulator)
MENAWEFILIGAAIGLFIGYYRRRVINKGYKNEPDRPFPSLWRQILAERVQFYQKLSGSDQMEFERKAHIFLLNVPIIGKGTEVTHEDKILIAAGAVIPIFRMSRWHYSNLEEIQLFPDQFNIPNTDKMANGLVGWGAMEGKMMLSKKAVHLGFADNEDNLNVVIHEFVHILDKQDGKMDGIIGKVMDEVDVTPWVHIIEKKKKQIMEGESSIRSYGTSNNAEFLAVVSEFYFESPERMKTEHPALFNALDSFYNEKPKRNVFSSRNRRNVGSYKKEY